VKITNNWIQLNQALKLPLPTSILSKLEAVRDEELQYAADEIVELAEEILNHISGLGIIYYLKSKQQKEVYNDFLIQLFNSSGHDYNAGPLFRWAANMIKEMEMEISKDLYSIFWKDGQLNKEVHHLAQLRNEVMHGFFVLPPERNFKEAESISELLVHLSKVGCFDHKEDFHFWGVNGFTGKWNITDENDWQFYELLDSSFGLLCQRIIKERSEAFWISEANMFKDINTNISEDIKEFIENNNKGACAIWIHPKAKSEIYQCIGKWLINQENILTIAYQLQNEGLSYSSGFLLNRLVQVLSSSGVPKNKKLEDVVRKLRAEQKGKKIVVLVNHIHLALFSPQHLTLLNNYFYENNILLVALGHHYEHFDKIFNKAIFNVDPIASIPTFTEAQNALKNYLRFKGPSKERIEERADVEKLEAILIHVLNSLGSGVELFARRFADEHHYDLEYVLEVFALLHPWVKSSREDFEVDTVDELYGFPSTMTEVTPIYLSLGRRDLKLEYQHKVISI
jgi:hypothetical protein